MAYTEITYPESDSGTQEMDPDLAEYYDRLIKFNSGSEGVTQYIGI